MYIVFMKKKIHYMKHKAVATIAIVYTFGNLAVYLRTT